MLKDRKWNLLGIPSDTVKIDLKGLLALEFDLISSKKIPDETTLTSLRDLQKETFQLFLDCLGIVDTLSHGDSKRLQDLYQAASRKEWLIEEFYPSYLRLHAYSAVHQMWTEVYNEFHERYTSLTDDQITLLKGKDTNEWISPFQKELASFKSQLNPILFWLNIKFPSLLTDNHIETEDMESVGLAPTGYERICSKYSEGNLFSDWRAIELVYEILDDLQSYSKEVHEGLSSHLHRLLGIDYNFNRIPKVKMGESLYQPLFKKFEAEKALIIEIRDQLIFDGSPHSPISTEHPKKIKELIRLLRDKKLIDIEDNNIPSLVRLLFNMPRKFYPQYPLKIPTFRIVSRDFGIDLKASIKRLKAEQIISGGTKDIGKVFNKVFQNDGLSTISIENSLKPSSKNLFKRIKNSEILDVINS